MHMRATSRKGLLFALICAAAMVALAPASAARAADPIVAAAGDIACSSLPTSPDSCQQEATSNLLVGRPLAAVLMLGDGSYEDGTLAQYQGFYDPTWGRLKPITHPAIGNHEYQTLDGQGYFQYFGAAAGDPRTGYYSYDVGTWHMIVLNSNCYKLGGCGASTPQVKWLKADLAAHPNTCTLAYWHHPHFSSGFSYDDNSGHNPTGAFWNELYAAGADLVLNGHDHDYERFGLQDPEGEPDPGYGIREFVVGTGGRSYSSFPTPSLNSEVREGSTYGVLELTLHRASYDWRFVPVAGRAFTDSGSGRCHGAPSAPLLKVSGPARKVSRKGTLRVYLSCSAVCTTRTQVTVPIGRRKIRSLILSRALQPELRSSVRVRFTKYGLGQIRQAFRKRTRLKAEVTARASVAGIDKSASTRLQIRLQR
jgi:acid phosphatase type 7